ncbi:Uncharacterized protein GBIM_05589, partial [Gryllus bimaculatus]
MQREAVVELLAAACSATAAAGCFLNDALFLTGAADVYIDGVDEIMPVHKEKVLRLLELLLQETHKDVRLWVAARHEAQISLCRVLRCTPVFLLPLSHSQQLDYLSKQWAAKLKVHPAVVQPFAREMVNAVAHIDIKRSKDFRNHLLDPYKILKVITSVLANSDLSDEHSPITQAELRLIGTKIEKRFNNVITHPHSVFTPDSLLGLLQDTLDHLTETLDTKIASIFHQKKQALVQNVLDYFGVNNESLLRVPLHIKMVAESFVEAAGAALKSGNSLLKERLNHLDIFQHFIDLKRTSLLKKHGQMNVNPSTWYKDMEDELFMKIHQTYAMKIFYVFIGENCIKSLEKDLKKFKPYLPKEKTGILWQLENEELQFAHFTYVEYFVASWLFKNLSGKHKKEAKRVARTVFERRLGDSVATFLNLMLCDGLRLHQAALAGDEAALQVALAQGA